MFGRNLTNCVGVFPESVGGGVVLLFPGYSNRERPMKTFTLSHPLQPTGRRGRGSNGPLRDICVVVDGSVIGGRSSLFVGFEPNGTRT